MWVCSKCEHENADNLSKCKICGTEKFEEDSTINHKKSNKEILPERNPLHDFRNLAHNSSADKKHVQIKSVYRLKIALGVVILISNALLQILNYLSNVDGPFISLIIMSIVPLVVIIICGKRQKLGDILNIVFSSLFLIGGLTFLVSPLVDSQLIRVAAGLLFCFSSIQISVSIYSIMRQNKGQRIQNKTDA